MAIPFATFLVKKPGSGRRHFYAPLRRGLSPTVGLAS